jgi:hypothetical protein
MSACPRQLPFPKPWQHLGIMKTTFVFVDFLLLATAAAQQHDEPHPKGVIYGVAIGLDGQPAKRDLAVIGGSTSEIACLREKSLESCYRNLSLTPPRFRPGSSRKPENPDPPQRIKCPTTLQSHSVRADLYCTDFLRCAVHPRTYHGEIRIMCR